MAILTNLLKAAVQFYQAVAAKPKLTNILMLLVKMIPEIISSVGQFGGLSDKGKIDDALETFDSVTGSDKGAYDLLKDLPADKEEEFMDHFKGMIQILAYNRLRVDGYHVPDASVIDPAADTTGDNT